MASASTGQLPGLTADARAAPVLARRNPEPAEEALRDLSRASLSGTGGHLLLLALVEFAIPGADHLPRQTVVSIFLGFLAVRCTSFYLMASGYRGSPRLRWALIAMGSIGANIVWGVRAVGVELHTGASEQSLVMAFLMCGVATGGVTALAPSRWIQRTSLAVLILPTVLVGLVEHSLSTPLVLLQALCFTYMYAQGGVAHRSYWKSVHAAEQLRCHAESAQLAAVAADATSLRLRAEIAHSAKMELELRQAQKLEAIGRLAAGIAHEINTPLQYIGDACRFMREGIEQFTSAFDEQQRIVTELAGGKLAGTEALVATAQLIEDRDLSYLRENLPEALTLAVDGLGRIGKIVTATTEFASPNVRQKTLASVNTAIESMLVIANNQTQTVADVKTELGELPSILCHPGELGQVFLQLLINAAHAIREVVQDTGARGLIRIKTWAEPGWIRISIDDTGTGIRTEDLEKIYEPFFTTKPVGMGTGQGLAIARSVIVGKHHGTIDVRSQLGAGSTFTIGLPIVR